MSTATTTPAVTLDNTDTLSDETLLVEYRDAKAAGEHLRHRMNRFFTAIHNRVKPTVQAAANKVILDANDRDIAVSFAIGKLAMDDEAFDKVLKAVRNGKTLANCVARFITPDSMKAELNQGRNISATGEGGGSMSVTPTDFTADETMVTVSGTSYTMDALDEALDAALHSTPTEADEALDWFVQAVSGHGVTLTQRETDALLHSTGLTREVDEYLDRLAASDRKEAARVLGSLEQNDERTGPARLPAEHVANLTGTSRRTASRDIDSAENAIWAAPALVRELRRGSNEKRRVIFEDIANHCANWLLDEYAQADMFPTETAVRAIPDSAWRATMDDFGYDTQDYSSDNISDIIETVIAYIPRNAHRRIIRHLVAWMKSRVTNRKPTEDQVLATMHLWQERIFDEFAYDLDEVSAEERKSITLAVIRGAKK
nr:hypothetical protein [Microbacterium barkeri]